MTSHHVQGNCAGDAKLSGFSISPVLQATEGWLCTSECVYTTPRKMSFLCNLFLCFPIQILLTNSSDSLSIFSFFAFKLEVFRACTKTVWSDAKNAKSNLSAVRLVHRHISKMLQKKSREIFDIRKGLEMRAYRIRECTLNRQHGLSILYMFSIIHHHPSVLLKSANMHRTRSGKEFFHQFSNCFSL